MAAKDPKNLLTVHAVACLGLILKVSVSVEEGEVVVQTLVNGTNGKQGKSKWNGSIDKGKDIQ